MSRINHMAFQFVSQTASASQFWDMIKIPVGTTKKEFARFLYTRQEISTTAIAITIGIEEPKIRKWVAEGAWGGMRQGLKTGAKNNVVRLHKLLQSLCEKVATDPEPNPKDVDLILKYSAAIKNLEPEVGICEIVEVAELFVLWLRTQNADIAKQTAALLDKFIAVKVKEKNLEAR
jgi:hypothetical protein